MENEEILEETQVDESIQSEELPEEQEAQAEEEAQAALDWSFKFQDEVREVPEEYRWFEEQEKAEKLKDLYQRAEAVEYHKQQTTSMREKLTGYEQQIGEWEPDIQGLARLRELDAKGDRIGVMKALGYGEDDILQLAKEVIDYKNMDPAQRQLLEEKQRIALEQEQVMAQNEMKDQQLNQTMAELTRMELDMALRDESASRIAQAYDAKHGAGKFRDLVIAQGEVAVARAGRHVPPSELVPQVVAQFAPFLAEGSAQETAAAAPAGEPAAKPKVIPNVKGKGSSIGRTSVNSIEDLRKLRQERYG